MLLTGTWMLVQMKTSCPVVGAAPTDLMALYLAQYPLSSTLRILSWKKMASLNRFTTNIEQDALKVRRFGIFVYFLKSVII